METTFIYALNDPETGECRYVGKADDPHDRLFGSNGHLYECKTETHHRANWINSLLARGLRPLLEILQEVPKNAWPLWERVWIKTSRAIGMNLTNGTEGGEGGPTMLGKKFSSEHRAKLSASQKGKTRKKLTPEHRAKLSARKRGKKRKEFTLAARAAMRIAQLGKKHSLETRAKMSAAGKKFWADKNK